MYEIQCLDTNGNTINNFFQWDCDQNIVIKLKGCDEKYLTYNPEVHFSNSSRDTALVTRSVSSKESDSETIVSEVPNILLQEPYPLLVYVYLTDAEDVSSQKTILYSEIPVRKRQKPHDYLYVENITQVTAETIKDEIASSTETVRQTAQDDITSTNESAKASVDATKTDFENACDAIVADATAIKNETQSIKDATQAASDATQATIESDMKQLMNVNGLGLKINNPDGNAVFTIVIPNTEGV